MNLFSRTILVLWLVVAFGGTFVSGDLAVHLDQALLAPQAGALLGTDPLGRSMITLLAGGAQTAFLIGVSAVVLAGTFGVWLGLIAGYFGGWVDTVIVRCIDVFLAFPGILLAIALTAILGPSTVNVILALSLLGWTGFARLVRGQTLQLKSLAFIDAAQTFGARPARVLLRHCLPNLIGPLSVQTTFAIAGAILAESSLSFLGLGDPTVPSWGGMLADGVQYLRQAPHLSVLPGLALALLILALNLEGDRLSDQYNNPENSS